MTVARSLKIDRESSARFSFLLATPITLAAVLVDIKDFVFNAQFFVRSVNKFYFRINYNKIFYGLFEKRKFQGICYL